MTNNEQEFFERVMYLEGIRYDLEDTIENILDYLLKTNITMEQMIELQKIAYKDKVDYPNININLKKALEVF